MPDGVTIPLEIVDTGGSAAINRMMQQSERMHASQKRMLAEGERGARALAGAYNFAGSAIEKTGHAATNAATRLTSSMQSAINTTLRWSAAITGLSGGAGGAGMGLLIRQGIRLNDEMQRYRITLTTVMHSQAQANAQISWMLRYAEQTPFQVHGLVEASTMLESFAINSRKWIPLVGDLASAFGGTNEQVSELVEAVGKLRSGLSGVAFRTFRRFGISHEDFERRGATFDKGGELTSDTDDAMNILEEIIQDRFGGMIERMRGTYTQVMSNIADVGTNVLRETVSPLFQEVTKDAGGFLAKLEEMRNDGTMAMLTDLTGNGLANLYGGIKSAVNNNIIQPFMEGQSAGDIIGNVLEKSKPYAEEFIGWFGEKLGQSVVGGIELAIKNPGTTAAIGAYYLAPSIVNAGGSAATAIATYMGMRGIAGSMGGGGVGGGSGIGYLARTPLTSLGVPAFGGGADAAYMISQMANKPSVSSGLPFAAAGAFMAQTAAAIGATVGAGAMAADSIASAITGNNISDWNVGGGIGKWVSSRFGTDNNFVETRNFDREAFERRFKEEKDKETKFRLGFAKKSGGLGEEYLGAFNQAMRLPDMVKSNTADGIRRLSESAEGLANNLLDVEERLQSSTDKMPRFDQRITDLYTSIDKVGVELGARRLDPREAATLLGGYEHQLSRARMDQFYAAQERIMLGVKAKQAGIKGNQGFAGQYIELMGADDTKQQAFLDGTPWTSNSAVASKMLDDYMRASEIRSMFELTDRRSGGLTSAEELTKLSYTGLIPEELTKQTAMEEMIRSAESTGKYSAEDINRFRDQFKNVGGLKLDTDGILKQLQELEQNFRLVRDEDLKAISEVADTFAESIEEAHQRGVERAAAELENSLGIVLTSGLKQIVTEAISSFAQKMREESKKNKQSDWTSEPFGTGN